MCALVSPSHTRSQKLARRRELQAVIENDPAFRKWDVPFLSRSERMRRAREKAAAAVGHVRRLGLEDPLELAAFFSHIDDLLPTELHRSMFTPTLAAQASDEQQAHWMPLAREYKIIGTYAQTELGHGSFVRGMETTATFDVDADAFVLNTPTLTSTKWSAKHTYAHTRNSVSVDCTQLPVSVPTCPRSLVPPRPTCICFVSSFALILLIGGQATWARTRLTAC